MSLARREPASGNRIDIKKHAGKSQRPHHRVLNHRCALNGRVNYRRARDFFSSFLYFFFSLYIVRAAPEFILSPAVRARNGWFARTLSQ
jgi:hypothetical protein